MAGLLAAWLCLSATAAEVPPTPAPPPPADWVETDQPAPWEAGPQVWVSPHHLEGLNAYYRYQKLAMTGVPLYVGGVLLGGYGVYALQFGVQDPASTTAMIGAGALLAWGGAGAITYGSNTAISRLFDGAPGPRRIPGTIAYGLLGISAGLFVGSVVNPFLFLAGIPFGIAAGVPALIQTAINPPIRGRWEERNSPSFSLAPIADPRAPGLALNWTL